MIALDISKALDQVWHAGLLKKLGAHGVSGYVFDIIKSFLSGRSIRDILDGQKSSTHSVNSGVPQGSILGPILFLIFINDLPDDLLSDVAIYADDTSLYSCLDRKSELFSRVEQAGELEYDLRNLTEWGDNWIMLADWQDAFICPALPPALLPGHLFLCISFCHLKYMNVRRCLPV